MFTFIYDKQKAEQKYQLTSFPLLVQKVCLLFCFPVCHTQLHNHKRKQEKVERNTVV